MAAFNQHESCLLSNCLIAVVRASPRKGMSTEPPLGFIAYLPTPGVGVGHVLELPFASIGKFFISETKNSKRGCCFPLSQPRATARALHVLQGQPWLCPQSNECLPSSDCMLQLSLGLFLPSLPPRTHSRHPQPQTHTLLCFLRQKNSDVSCHPNQLPGVMFACPKNTVGPWLS